MVACNGHIDFLDRNLLTCDRDLLTCDHNLLTCNRNLLNCDRNLLTCDRNLITCDRNLLTCDHNLQTCDPNLLAVCGPCAVRAFRACVTVCKNGGRRGKLLSVYCFFSLLVLRLLSIQINCLYRYCILRKPTVRIPEMKIEA